jgi:hypothetical protein
MTGEAVLPLAGDSAERPPRITNKKQRHPVWMAP